MFNVGTDWNPKQALLKNMVTKPDEFNGAIQLCLAMHSMVHESAMTQAGEKTYEDEIWDSLDRRTFETMPTEKDVTIAWNIWHITRIEDLTVNFLISGGEQVFNEDWRSRMNSDFYDTGNAMTDEQILALSRSFNIAELRNYRNEVGRRTRSVLEQLTQPDMKRKVNPKDLQRIHSAGGVTDQAESVWLLDFWGRKNVSGLLLMPVTRHQIVHLNDCVKLKQKCRKL